MPSAHLSLQTIEEVPSTSSQQYQLRPMSDYSNNINPQPLPGSLFDHLHDTPPPVIPTRFDPFSSHVTHRRETPTTDDRFPCVTFHHYTPRVCGIQQDNTTVKLMDSESNIILTNNISLLRELQDITPLQSLSHSMASLHWMITVQSKASSP